MADTSMRIAGGSSAGLPQGTGLPQGKKSAAGWLMYFAGKHKIVYSASVLQHCWEYCADWLRTSSWGPW